MYTTNERQNNDANTLTQIGFDGIFGHGPHVVQKTVVKNEAIVDFSAGNVLSLRGKPHTKIGKLSVVEAGTDMSLTTTLFQQTPGTKENPIHLREHRPGPGYDYDTARLDRRVKKQFPDIETQPSNATPFTYNCNLLMHGVFTLGGGLGGVVLFAELANEFPDLVFGDKETFDYFSIDSFSALNDDGIALLAAAIFVCAVIGYNLYQPAQNTIGNRLTWATSEAEASLYSANEPLLTEKEKRRLNQ